MSARPVRTRGGLSEAGSWELAEAPPGPGLEGFVRHYVGFVESSPAPLRRRETPSANTVLIVNLGAPIEVGAPGRTTVTHTDSFVARMSELPATTVFHGTSAGVQVDFTPLGLRMFCDLAADEMPDPAVALDELIGADGRRLTEAIADAPDWRSRFDILDAEIARRFAAARPLTPSIAWAWEMLESSGGRAPIAELVERIGCSPRHLIGGFRRHVGVTPKVAARILRFDHAAGALRRGSDASLAATALRCGFHDQAHMTREFKDFAGITPAAYRAASLPGHLGVAAPPNG